MQVGERVSVAEPQIRGTSATVSSGEIVELSGSKALVAMDGEEVPRPFDIKELSSAASVFGFTSPSPYDNQVTDAIRRR